MTGEKLVNWLYNTGAFKVCPEGKPFWYTSGTIGPYYVNTHFLYGSEKKALELLDKIDALKADKLSCPGSLLPLVEYNYNSDEIYKGITDSLLEFINDNIDLDTVDYISGGERRDWFFSLIVASKLKKPHITIYKDLDAVITEDGETYRPDSICGACVMHITDLVTEASSFERAWIPAIRNIGGQLACSVAVVDRMQGGKEILESHNISSFAMVSVNREFFGKALEKGLINKGQYDMLLEYTKDPRKSMKKFLDEHPDFLEKSLCADARTRERAKLCISKGIYE
ncbi:MAG: orotate phosphoribosyltransferase [Acetivibrionales bacterium]|jgi:orotate phosphoribosyltransferase